jgi:heat-inducible transcriptional repressor
MTMPALDDRKSEVLRSIVDLHVQTGEPVGSESLSRLLKRSLSPATLRAIMADLEALGYLDHPHTSAGRLPTDEGYRCYVDQLMRRAPLAPSVAATIDDRLRRGTASPSQILENASSLLSRLSRNVGFVLVPELTRETFRHLDLVRLAPPRILVVLVSQAGLVTNKVIEVEEDLSQEQLQECANYLNQSYAGLTIDQIRVRLLELMSEEKALYDSLLAKVVQLGARAFDEDGSEAEVFLDGRSNILDQTGIEDIETMRALFRTFEEKGRLVKILNACVSGEGLRVLIGHENPEPDLRSLSMVTTAQALEGGARWTFGVLGSTRMEYAHVISLVDHVARAAAEILRGETT